MIFFIRKPTFAKSVLFKKAVVDWFNDIENIFVKNVYQLFVRLMHQTSEHERPINLFNPLKCDAGKFTQNYSFFAISEIFFANSWNRLSIALFLSQSDQFKIQMLSCLLHATKVSKEFLSGSTCVVYQTNKSKQSTFMQLDVAMLKATVVRSTEMFPTCPRSTHR